MDVIWQLGMCVSSTLRLSVHQQVCLLDAQLLRCTYCDIHIVICALVTTRPPRHIPAGPSRGQCSHTSSPAAAACHTPRVTTP